MKYKKQKLQRNQSIIALDYLKITGAKDLEDLKLHFPYFFEKYIEEKNRVSGFFIEKEKIETKISRIPFAHLVDEVILCKKCQKVLIYIIFNKKLYFQDSDYKNINGVITIKCICGTENIFI